MGKWISGDTIIICEKSEIIANGYMCADSRFQASVTWDSGIFSFSFPLNNQNITGELAYNMISWSNGMMWKKLIGTATTTRKQNSPLHWNSKNKRMINHSSNWGFFLLSLYFSESNVVEAGCDPGWKYFKGNCYFVSPKFKDWEDARNDCRMKGADLTSIQSNEENNFLSRLNVSVPWKYIGGRKDGNLFSWSDGNNFQYQNWDFDEPNKDSGSCLTMISCTDGSDGTICGSNGKWRLNPCNSGIRYICKKSSKSNF